MKGTDRLHLNLHAGTALQALAGVEQMLATSDLDARLGHLVKLRASQINSCAYCVGMHTEEARRDGESSERLDRLVVWRDVDCFSTKERAALAWTEALTKLDEPSDLDRLHTEISRHFSEGQIGLLTVQIAMINVWNRLQIGSHGGRQLQAA